MLGDGLQRLVFKKTLRLPRRCCCTWRGGGFRDVHKTFFQRGKIYSVPGFLATSMEVGTAMKFIRRADRTHPRILWCIMVRLPYCTTYTISNVGIPTYLEYRDNLSICLCSSTFAAELTKNFDANTQSLWRRPKLKERWNSSTHLTPYSR